MSNRPVLISIPRDDELFRDHVERLALSVSAAPSALQAALRTLYPDAVVRARDLTGERGVVWYVYRDGHWTRSAGTPGG